MSDEEFVSKTIRLAKEFCAGADNDERCERVAKATSLLIITSITLMQHSLKATPRQIKTAFNRMLSENLEARRLLDGTFTVQE